MNGYNCRIKKFLGGKTYVTLINGFILLFNKKNNNEELKDYKVLCFNGEPKLIEVHKGRFNRKHTQDIYDVNWVKTSITQPDMPISDEVISRPKFLDEMLLLSRKLSSGICHIRVDWYYTNNQLYFGELTFFDGSGFEPFCGNADKLLGSWIKLPKNNSY